MQFSILPKPKARVQSSAGPASPATVTRYFAGHRSKPIRANEGLTNQQPARLPIEGSRAIGKTEALEAQAQRLGAELSLSPLHAAFDFAGSGGNISQSLREPLERALNVDLSGVTVHTDSHADNVARSSGADAVACNQDIFFAKDRLRTDHRIGRELLYHELTHVAQQQADASSASVAITDEQIRSAEIAIGLKERVIPARRGSLQLSICQPDAKQTAPTASVKYKNFTAPQKGALLKLTSGQAIARSDATLVLDGYATLSAAERDSAIAELHTLGAPNSYLAKLLATLNKSDINVTYRDTVKDMLHRVQQQSTRSTSGLSDDDLARKQGGFMQAEAEAEALRDAAEKAKKLGKPAPTTVSPADVQAAHKRLVDQSSIKDAPTQTEWDRVKDKKAWMADAILVRSALVARLQKVAPELRITDANITLDPKSIADRGEGIFALSGNPLTVGVQFVKAAKANPDYVMGTIVHEISGHPAHGGMTEVPEWKLYDASRKYFPAKQPLRAQDYDLYGYQGTEIYSEMREYDYFVPVSSADAVKGVVAGDAPTDDIPDRVANIKKNFQADVAKGILVGLHERFRIDPRVSAKALKLFTDAVNKNFPGLLKI